MITLKEISHSTGYSISTISKALNGKNDISEAAKKRISDFALKNDYVPNKNAIALRRNKSYIIAIILPQVNDSFYSEALSNIQKMASTQGYRIILFQSFEEETKERACLDEVKDGSVDGVMILSPNEGENIGNKFRELYSIPLEFMQIEEKQPINVLKENYISNFENLLKQMK